ncbi:MAG: hypothetical protein JRI68_19835 [Deltaproteobacteria bacterium]|nr:hypothetical protein [Deltaproteobacteria bacterium]
MASRKQQWITTVVSGLALGLLVLGACSDSTSDNGSSSSSSSSGLDAGECRASDDCDESSGEMCFYPGQPNCGACFGGNYPCSIDEQCVTQLGAGHVCGPLEGPCTCGDGDCIPACTGDGDCETLAQECNPEGHCIVKTCAVDDDCGDPTVRCAPGGTCVVFQCDADAECDGNHECTDSYHCSRKSCTSDTDCAGYCVQSSCYDTPGSCSGLAP